MILRWRMVPTFFRAVWHAGVYLWHGWPVLAPKSVVAYREAKCRVCRYKEWGQCRKCAGCFIGAKVLVASEQCPDSPPRWRRLTFAIKPTIPQ